MPSCVLCGGETFDEFDGHFYCENCGTQSQEIRNEAEVEEDVDNIGFGHSQQRQIKTKRKKSGPKAKYPPTDFGKPWLTYEAFQCLLKAQVKSLVELGVDPALKTVFTRCRHILKTMKNVTAAKFELAFTRCRKNLKTDIVCQIWFRYLSRKKVAFTGAKEGSTIAIENMKLQRDLQSGETPKHSTVKVKQEKDDVTQAGKDIEQTERLDLDEVDMLLSPGEGAYEAMSEESNYSDSDESQQSSDTDEIETEEHTGSLKCKHDGSKSWSRLQQRLTIVIVYLGLLYTKEPITLADLVRFIDKGLVPYHRISEVLPSHMKMSNEDLRTTFLIRPVRIAPLHIGASFLINFLDLPKIPEPDIFLIVAKLVLDFQLPAAIHRLTISLMKASDYSPRTNFRGNNEAKNNEYYEEMAMAFIIVALKLIYGLDGDKERNGRILQKFLDKPQEQLECWNCIAVRLEHKQADDIRYNYPTSESDLRYMTDFRNYATYCSEDIYKEAPGHRTSKQKPGNIHSQYRACMTEAKEEYAQMMRRAVSDLEGWRRKEFQKLPPSSFVYDKVPIREGSEIGSDSCKCHWKTNLTEKMSNKDATTTKAQEVEDSYLIYLNDFSGLNFHDSYKFLLGICSRRILLRPNEMHDFVTYVETLLFVDT